MIEQLTFLIMDLKRWKFSSFKSLFYLFFEQAIWGTIFYRISRALFLINIPVVKIFLRFISFFIFKFSESIFGVAIRPATDIGPGIYIGHAGMVMINDEVKAGKNLSIGPGVLAKKGAVRWLLANIFRHLKIFRQKISCLNRVLMKRSLSLILINL